MALGLVHTLADDPEAAALGLLRRTPCHHERGVAGLRLAAVRAPMLRECAQRLAEVERLYLDRLMKTHDANEGLAAFLAQAAHPPGSTADESPPLRSPSLQIVQRCEALFEDLHFNAVKEWKAAVPGRKAIGYMPVYVPRELIHAAGMLPVGHPRRRRRARGDPGRRLLPELHLPHPALDDRTRPDRAARLPGRHAVPVDLRRDPQPLGHVEDAVQGQVRPLHRRAAELPGRSRRQVLHGGDADPARGPGPARRPRDHRCRPQRVDPPSTTTTAPRSASSTSTAPPSPGRRRPPRSTCCCAPAWCCRSRSTPRSCASTWPPPRRCRAPSATTPASSSTAASASSRRWR